MNTVKEKGGKPDRKPRPLSRNPYRNLKSENLQAYAQKPQKTVRSWIRLQVPYMINGTLVRTANVALNLLRFHPDPARISIRYRLMQYRTIWRQDDTAIPTQNRICKKTIAPPPHWKKNEKPEIKLDPFRRNGLGKTQFSKLFESKRSLAYSAGFLEESGNATIVKNPMATKLQHKQV